MISFQLLNWDILLINQYWLSWLKWLYNNLIKEKHHIKNHYVEAGHLRFSPRIPARTEQLPISITTIFCNVTEMKLVSFIKTILMYQYRDQSIDKILNISYKLFDKIVSVALIGSITLSLWGAHDSRGFTKVDSILPLICELRDFNQSLYSLSVGHLTTRYLPLWKN